MMAQDRYGFDRRFEIVVAYACAALPRFYDVLGHAIEPDAMPSEDAKLLVSAARQVALDTGAGCPSVAFAVQKLRDRAEEGKLTHEQVGQVRQLVELAEDLGGWDDLDALVTLAAQTVKKRATHQAKIEAIGRPDADAGEIAASFEKVATLGTRRASVGAEVLLDEDDIAASCVKYEQLRLGITDIDSAIDGGLERGATGLFIADTGVGKSFFLCHVAVTAMLAQQNVAYLTLELPVAEVKKRVYSNLLDIESAKLAAARPLYGERLRLLRQRGAIGAFVVKYDSPRACTPSYVRDWLKELERGGKRYDVVIIDYIDKMASGHGRKESHTYKDQGDIIDALRDMNIDRKGWLWTASQIKAGSSQKRKLHADDAADSKNKPRSADLVIGGLTDHEDQNMIEFTVIKRRLGEVFRDHVGPMVMDRSFGRIVPVVRNMPWTRGPGGKL